MEDAYVSEDILYNIYSNLDIDQLLEIANENKSKVNNRVVNYLLRDKIYDKYGVRYHT